MRIVSTSVPRLQRLDAQLFARPESKPPRFTARSFFLRLRIGYRQALMLELTGLGHPTCRPVPRYKQSISTEPASLFDSLHHTHYVE